jgi:hypothetical protein
MTRKSRKTLGIGGVPGWILLCWNVGMAERMLWFWFNTTNTHYLKVKSHLMYIFSFYNC